ESPASTLRSRSSGGGPVIPRKIVAASSRARALLKWQPGFRQPTNHRVPRAAVGAQAFEARRLTAATSAMALTDRRRVDFTDVWPGSWSPINDNAARVDVLRRSGLKCAFARSVMAGQIVPVIMCGGAGTRLWPVSRESMPKQFVPLIGQASTFQQVLARITDPELFARPIVITNADFRFVVAA